MNIAKGNEIVALAKNSAEALRNLYELEKSTDRRRSLAYICRRAGIPSTGYLSDVFSGKRILNPKYRLAIAKVFSISSEAAACLRILIDIDNEKDIDRSIKLHKKLASTRKLLFVSYLPINSAAGSLFEAINIFCAFGLFNNRASVEQLTRYFSWKTADQIVDSLELLVSLKLVRKDGDLYEVLSQHVVFEKNENGIGLSHVEFIKLAILHASENAEKWFEKKDQAYFASSVASVKKADYVTQIQKIKADMLQVQSDLESKEADMLVRFNVQIYPL